MRLLSKLGVGILALTAAWTAVPSTGYAMNAQRQIGYGVKSKGMGGVGIALPQDSLVAAMNPAGMPYVADRVDIGLGYVFQNGKTNVTTTGQTFKTTRGVWLPEGGISYMFCPCQTIGLSVYVDGGLVSKYNGAIPGFTNPTFDQGKSLELSYYQLIIAPSWAWRINRVHSVGVALNVAVTEFKVNGFGAAATTSFFPNNVTNQNSSWSEGMSVRFGWLGNVCDRLMVGFTFQTKTWVRKYKKYQGLLPDAGQADLPGSLGFGVTYFPFSCIALSAEYSYVMWDKVTNNFWAALETGNRFGAKDGPGVSWNSQGVFKVGAYYRLLPCLTLRVGYNWAQNPVAVTDTQVNVISLPIVEHHVTTGATYACGCNEFSFFYWYGFRKHVNGQNPLIVPPTTSGYNIKNQQQSVGVAYGRCF